MVRFLALVGVVVAAIAVARFEAAGEQVVWSPTFYDGNGFRSLPEVAQLTYIAGVLDANAMTAQPDSPFKKCFVGGKFSSGFTLGQAHAIVTGYLNANPDKWNLYMAALVTLAIDEACKRPY